MQRKWTHHSTTSRCDVHTKRTTVHALIYDNISNIANRIIACHTRHCLPFHKHVVLCTVSIEYDINNINSRELRRHGQKYGTECILGLCAANMHSPKLRCILQTVRHNIYIDTYYYKKEHNGKRVNKMPESLKYTNGE